MIGLLVEHPIQIVFFFSIVVYWKNWDLMSSEVIVSFVDSEVFIVFGLLLNHVSQIVIFELVQTQHQVILSYVFHLLLWKQLLEYTLHI